MVEAGSSRAVLSSGMAGWVNGLAGRQPCRRPPGYSVEPMRLLACLSVGQQPRPVRFVMMMDRVFAIGPQWTCAGWLAGWLAGSLVHPTPPCVVRRRRGATAAAWANATSLDPVSRPQTSHDPAL